MNTRGIGGLLGTVGVAAVALSPILSGCGGGRSGGARAIAGGTGLQAGSTVSGSGATAGGGGTTTPGSTTGGGTTPPPARDFDPPVITVTSPLRGTMTNLPAIAVSGTATDAGTGLRSFTLNGQAVQVSLSGDFSVNVALGTGINILTLEASDNSNNIAEVSLSVLSGDLLPGDQMVQDAVAARVTQAAFDTLSPTIGAQVVAHKPDVVARVLAQNPIMNQRVLWITIRTDATGFDFQGANVVLDPVAGGVQFAATLTDLNIPLRARVRTGFSFTLTGRSTMSTLTIGGLARIGVTPAVTLDASVQNLTVRTTGFNLDMRWIPNFIESLLRSRIQRMVEEQLQRKLSSQIPGEIATALQGVGAPITRTVLGHPITFSFTPTTVAADDDGVTLALDANLSAPPDPNVPAAPGSLATAGTAPALGGATPMFQAALNDDFANRALYAAWSGGLMNVTIDNTFVQSMPLPLPITLNTDLLFIMFPQLRAAIPAGQPLVFRVAPLLPPVTRVGAATSPDLVQLSVGDLLVEIATVDPATGASITICRLALQLQVGVTPSQQGANLKVSIGQLPIIRLDVIAQPLVPLPARDLQILFGQVLPAIVHAMGNAHQGMPIPALGGVTVTNLTFAAGGPAGDFLQVAGDIR